MSCFICENFIHNKAVNQICIRCSFKGKDYISKLLNTFLKNLQILLNLIFSKGFWREIRRLALSIRQMGVGYNDGFNIGVMSCLDYYFYNNIYYYKLTDLPELSRYRLKIEFLFLNYYTDYEKRFNDASDVLVQQNTIMEHSSYLFASRELFDLKDIFGLETLEKCLSPERSHKKVNRKLIF
jgi:hypothetical protein